MKAMFANLTTADFRGHSLKEQRAAERRRVHALFDMIQVAIQARDGATVDDLMAELAANAKAGQEVAEAQLREISERLAALEVRVAALETPKQSA